MHAGLAGAGGTRAGADLLVGAARRRLDAVLLAAVGRELVRDAIAVVVERVAELERGGIDGDVAVVAVEPAAADAVAVAVGVLVDAAATGDGAARIGAARGVRALEGARAVGQLSVARRHARALARRQREAVRERAAVAIDRARLTRRLIHERAAIHPEVVPEIRAEIGHAEVRESEVASVRARGRLVTSATRGERDSSAEGKSDEPERTNR